MKITFDWIKDHLDTKFKEDKLLEQLTNVGLEVEGVENLSAGLDLFKVAKILKTEKHPNADRLKVCDVDDAGSNEVNGQPRAFEHGMVTTIEPGIYVRPTKPVIEFPLLERDPNEIRERRKIMGMEKATKLEKEEMMNAKTVKHEIPKDLLGIGVRIEDDIVCTNNGPMNLTENAPKTIEEIEAVTA